MSYIFITKVIDFKALTSKGEAIFEALLGITSGRVLYESLLSDAEQYGKCLNDSQSKSHILDMNFKALVNDIIQSLNPLSPNIKITMCVTHSNGGENFIQYQVI